MVFKTFFKSLFAEMSNRQTGRNLDTTHKKILPLKESTKKFDLSWLISKSQLKAIGEDSLAPLATKGFPV